MEMDRSKQIIFELLIFIDFLLVIISNADLILKVSLLKKIKLNKIFSYYQSKGSFRS